jgi:multidrug efflux pump subunit AcrA (membrane-fusion protein)
VRRGSIEKRLVLDGELRAVRSRTLFATNQGETKVTYLAPEGSIIRPGDRLVELDSSSVTDKIRDLDEKIVAAENEIVQTQSNQESALRDMQVELSRLWLAYEEAKVKARIPSQILARREYQENQLNSERTKTEYENQITKIAQKQKEQAAELEVKVIERDKLVSQLEREKGNLETLHIKSPVEAMVIHTERYEERRKIQVGDVVWDGYPLAMLPDLREMEVLAAVNEVDGPKLATGQKASVVLDSYPDTRITGTIREISQTAVKVNRMGKAKIFYVYVALDRTVMEIMKPGMSAQVTVSLGEHAGELVVPRGAVRFQGSSAEVLRFEGDEQRRPIAVTLLDSDPERFAVAGNGALRQGDRIAARWPGEAR